ncbi:uncharacterized protein G2W53_017120 [Senna tora]|uniref:Uncharacterized protein n=1 Tax=Senna tora TaxID=362788 RepID=A0A834TS64_9FABA|nr:uncharacterized protein G2W53_017120 [Senna tora]
MISNIRTDTLWAWSVKCKIKKKLKRDGPRKLGLQGIVGLECGSPLFLHCREPEVIAALPANSICKPNQANESPVPPLHCPHMGYKLALHSSANPQ